MKAIVCGGRDYNDRAAVFAAMLDNARAAVVNVWCPYGEVE